MIIDHKHRALIGTPPKTGATSLDSAVRLGHDLPDGLEVVYWPGHGKKAHGLLIPPGAARYTKYLTVRHPLDRLVSLYYHMMRPYEMAHEWPAESETLFKMDDFDDFVYWWIDRRKEHGFHGASADFELPDGAYELKWWRSPNIWLIGLGECVEVFKPHSLIRLETYIEDLQQINSYFAKMPHKKKAGTDTSWHKHYTGRALRAILTHSAEAEMELLGYSLEEE